MKDCLPGSGTAGLYRGWAVGWGVWATGLWAVAVGTGNLEAGSWKLEAGSYPVAVTFEEARAAMVREQLVAHGIRDTRVLEVMGRVQRERFVPVHHAHSAYEDRPLPIAEGQMISQPYMVAVMTEALNVGPGHHVLEIGTGSGYQAAVLGLLARDVISVERHRALAETATRVLRDVNISNVRVVVGDGTEGWAEAAPYDRILVTAGAPAVPSTLLDQLAPDGRLVIPVGPPGVQHLTMVTRTNAGFETETGVACVFVPLVGRKGWPG